MKRATVLDKKSEKVRSTANKKCESKEPCNDTGTLQQNFDFINFFGQLLGWECSYDWTWKNNVRHWISISVITFSLVQILYTQFMHFLNGDNMRILECFSLYGGAISSQMFYDKLQGNKGITQLYFQNYSTCGRLSAEQLKNAQLHNMKLYKFNVFMILQSLFTCVLNPIRSYIVNREYILILPIEIMFIDQSQFSGFLIGNLIMSGMGAFLICLSLFMSLNFYALIFNYAIQVDLIEADIRQLDAFWSNTKATNLSERHWFLRNICKKCQDKDDYITKVKKIFDNTIYLYFVGVYISQIICLYEVEVQHWTPGYSLAYGMFVELLFHCYFGTKGSIANERLFYALKNSNWYTYDIHSQKIFLNLLNKCMNFKELWIGPLAPLSVVTGIQILKTIYSYYAFLTEAM